MPSLTLWPQSGGQPIADSNLWSGQKDMPVSFLTLMLSKSGAGPVYVGLPPTRTPATTGMISGYANLGSGGPYGSGSASGLLDAFELNPGQSYEIPKYRLVSGLLTPRIVCPAASSGSRLFWEADVRVGQ